MNDRKKKHRCPMCKRETTWDGNLFRPFCSDRCRLTDLGKWASEEYRISGKTRDRRDKENKDGR